MAAYSNNQTHIYNWILEVIKSSKTVPQLESSARLAKLFKLRFPEADVRYNTLVYYTTIKRKHR